jgi:hypothetical protein
MPCRCCTNRFSPPDADPRRATDRPSSVWAAVLLSGRAIAIADEAACLEQRPQPAWPNSIAMFFERMLCVLCLRKGRGCLVGEATFSRELEEEEIEVKRRPVTLKQWVPVTSSDGLHQGSYEVSKGMLTVRLGDRQKSVRATSIGIPVSMAAAAHEMLAKVILSELAA